MSQISKLVVCGDAQSMVLNFNDKGNLDAVFFAEGDNGRETYKLNPVSHEQPITKEVRQRVFSILFFESMKSEKGHENMTAVLNQISGEDEAVAEQVIEHSLQVPGFLHFSSQEGNEKGLCGFCRRRKMH